MNFKFKKWLQLISPFENSFNFIFAQFQDQQLKKSNKLLLCVYNHINYHFDENLS